MKQRIYLDNAATSWPKPESVYSAIDDYQRHVGMALGRSEGAMSNSVRHSVSILRKQILELANAGTAQLVFTSGGTDSLNLAIHGTLLKGDHVVTTTGEHNSVLRPLRWLEERGVISVSVVESSETGTVEPTEILSAVRPHTKLVAVNHVSNVTGAENPVLEIGQKLADSNVLFLVDGAQSIGQVPVLIEESKIDLFAFPGHKGLLGPLGTGGLIVGSKAQDILMPIRQGGTGSSSDQDSHPIEFPSGYEAGNLNTPGLMGLKAGIEYVKEHNVTQLELHKKNLTQLIMAGLKDESSIRLVSDPETRVGIISFAHELLSPSEFANILDSEFHTQVRAGFHCAPLVHRDIGCPNNGCVRLSVGPFTTETEAQTAVSAVQEICRSV